MTYTHRNGEKILPAQEGAFWLKFPSGRLYMSYVSREDGDWIQQYMGDEWQTSLSSPDFGDCQWWGPVEMPE